MYTCRVLVKHGVSLVTRSRRGDSTLAPPSDAHFGFAAAAPACGGDSGFSLLRVRSLLGARLAARSHVDSELLQWRSAGSLGSASSGSTGSVSVGRPRSAAHEAGVEVAGASISVAERVPKSAIA